MTFNLQYSFPSNLNSSSRPTWTVGIFKTQLPGTIQDMQGIEPLIWWLNHENLEHHGKGLDPSEGENAQY